MKVLNNTMHLNCKI